MDNAKNNCLVCGSQMVQTHSWLACCPSCQFLRSSLTAGAGTGVGGLETLRRINFKTILNKLENISHLRNKTLLEIGCSTGLFLEEYKRVGINSIGLEPEKRKADIARANGHDVIDGFFPDAVPQGQKYDIIVFNDVFEHLPDPVAALHACYHHLSPSGLLVINIPDSEGFLYRLSKILSWLGMDAPFERLWQKQFSSPHISYFQSRNLQKLVEGRTLLKLLESDRLVTMTAQGLKQRIKSSTPEPFASLIFMPVLLVAIFQRILPSDILLHIYRKNEE